MNLTTTEHHVPPVDSPLAQDPVFLLEKLGALGSIDANHALAEHCLKVRDYAVLSLSCNTPAQTQRELAEMLTLDPSQIVAIVDTLQKKDLVDRVPNPQDRRVKLIEATAQGKCLIKKIQVDLSLAQETTFKELSTKEIEQLTKLLHKAIYGTN